MGRGEGGGRGDDDDEEEEEGVHLDFVDSSSKL
jgi:hypothetical protein